MVVVVVVVVVVAAAGATAAVAGVVVVGVVLIRADRHRLPCAITCHNFDDKSNYYTTAIS
jgi:hypothetical protein